MKITAISNIHFDGPTYQKFVTQCNAYPVSVSHRPHVDAVGGKVLDEQGNEQTQTILEFEVDREKSLQLIPALQALESEVWVDGVPVVEKVVAPPAQSAEKAAHFYVSGKQVPIEPTPDIFHK